MLLRNFLSSSFCWKIILNFSLTGEKRNCRVKLSQLTTCYSLLTLLIILIYASSADAQNKKQIDSTKRGEPINIINADELEYSELGGIRTRKLTGNVQLQQKNVTLYCDRANDLLDSNIIIATGNVRIKQGDTIN